MSTTHHTKRSELIRSFHDAGDVLRSSLKQSRLIGCLSPFVIALRDILTNAGIEVDRINLPASKIFGFRHPLYRIANITWSRDQDLDVHNTPHPEREMTREELHVIVKESPYASILSQDQRYMRVDLRREEQTYSLLQKLKSQGYQDYLGIGITLPSGMTQPLSIAARRPFPAYISEYVDMLQPLLSLCLDSLYQGHAASSLAQSYIGNRTGLRVLAGDFVRGRTQMIKAGILFCDIRGFTSLSENLGAVGVVSVVNQIFEVIGQVVQTHGGEILKFIGDAILIIFADQDEARHQSMINAMISTVKESLQEVHALGAQLNLPLSIGFGAHVGEVLYGNIGTPLRLDFTVMGPAVNLASRLESLCKTLGVSSVFSSEVVCGDSPLKPLGSEVVKGIAEPVKVWGLDSAG